MLAASEETKETNGNAMKKAFVESQGQTVFECLYYEKEGRCVPISIQENIWDYQDIRKDYSAFVRRIQDSGLERILFMGKDMVVHSKEDLAGLMDAFEESGYHGELLVCVDRQQISEEQARTISPHGGMQVEIVFV